MFHSMSSIQHWTIKRTDFTDLNNITSNWFTMTWAYNISGWYYQASAGSNQNSNCTFNVPTWNRITKVRTRMHVYWPRYARTNSVVDAVWWTQYIRFRTGYSAWNVSNNITSYNWSATSRANIWPLQNAWYIIEITHTSWAPIMNIYNDSQSLIATWTYFYSRTGNINLTSLEILQGTTSENQNYFDRFEVEYQPL